MRFHIITIFPEIIKPYFQEGIIGRAVQNKQIEVNVYNLRDFTLDKHAKVDDTPYGGGPGMVLRADIVYYCVEEIKKNIEKRRGEFNSKRAKIILFSAKGSKYNQKKALEWSKNLKDLILICGRYEGVDERVAKFIADEEISIGEYVLSGGEIPAMAAVDSVSRLLPGVLGNKESLCIESYNPKNKTFETDFPVYTKPEKFNNWRVPKVLLSGNHQRIENWRRGKQVRKDKNTN